MRYSIITEKGLEVLQTDSFQEVESFFQNKCETFPDGNMMFRTSKGTFEKMQIAGLTEDDKAALGMTSQSPEYMVVSLRGGPKDGHSVRFRIGKIGTKIQQYRPYKLKDGRLAWYTYNQEEKRYEFAHIEEGVIL